MSDERTTWIGGVEVMVPRPPNFIRIAGDGDHKIPIRSLSDDALVELGGVFGEAMCEHAAALRAMQRKDGGS